MKKILALTLMVSLAPSAVMARDCDQDAATVNWEQAEDHGIILGAGMMNSMPTFSVDEAIWRDLDYNTRMGMVSTFECMVMGPGRIIPRAQIVSAGGERLASWDGIGRNLEFD